VGSDKENKSKVSEISYEIDYENNFETFITLVYYTKEEI